MNKLRLVRRAIKFYEQCPDGQYDELAVEALKRYEKTFKSIPLATHFYVNGHVRIKKDGQTLILSREEAKKLHHRLRPEKLDWN